MRSEMNAFFQTGAISFVFLPARYIIFFYNGLSPVAVNISTFFPCLPSSSGNSPNHVLNFASGCG